MPKPKTVHAARIAALHPKSSKATEESLVHLTGSDSTPAIYTETFWIVVQEVFALLLAEDEIA